MKNLFSCLVQAFFAWAFFISSTLASVSFVDDLNFTFEEIKTGSKGNVAVVSEKSSFYAVDTPFDINYFHGVLKLDAEKTGIQDSNLATVGFSLMYATGVGRVPYIVATDTLDLKKFSIIYESGFSDRPKDGRKKCVYASCGQQASDDEVKYSLEALFNMHCKKTRFSCCPLPRMVWTMV